MMTYIINCDESSGEFGISAVENEIIVKTVEGITKNQKHMQELADMCTRLEVDLCHLDDIIEDYLTDFCL